MVLEETSEDQTFHLRKPRWWQPWYTLRSTSEIPVSPQAECLAYLKANQIIDEEVKTGHKQIHSLFKSAKSLNKEENV